MTGIPLMASSAAYLMNDRFQDFRARTVDDICKSTKRSAYDLSLFRRRDGANQLRQGVRVGEVAEDAKPCSKWQEVSEQPKRRKSSVASVLKLKRKPTGESDRSMSIAEEKGECVPLERFLALPTEIVSQILCELSFGDILSFRLVGRSFQNVLAACESSVVRHWVKHELSSLHTLMYPAPAPGEARIRYLLKLRRKHLVAHRLTANVCEFFFTEYLRMSERDMRRHGRMWDSLYNTMTPLLFMLGRFLEQHRKAMLERCLSREGEDRPFELASGRGIVDFEKEILGTFFPKPTSRDDELDTLFVETEQSTDDRKALVDMYYMHCFLKQVLTRHLRPPTYAGHVERVVRGWTLRPASQHEVAIVLSLGGTELVLEILERKAYNDRRRVAEDFVRSLYCKANPSWRQSWEQLGTGISPVMLERLPRRAVEVPEARLILEQAAVDMILEQDLETEEQLQAVKSTGTYVRQLMRK